MLLVLRRSQPLLLGVYGRTSEFYITFSRKKNIPEISDSKEGNLPSRNPEIILGIRNSAEVEQIILTSFETIPCLKNLAKKKNMFRDRSDGGVGHFLALVLEKSAFSYTYLSFYL